MLLEQLGGIVGSGHVLTGESVAARTDAYASRNACAAIAVVRPADHIECARVVRLCFENEQPLVVHGGLTGLARGAQAQTGEVALSLERMTHIDPVDPIGRTVAVQAGATIAAVQDAASEAGLAFALDFGSRGSATVGGAISTNAGGMQVLRFGMMRDQILGLRAILPDGTIVDSMHHLIKNNTGYDVKQWFVGAEGTLGVVTDAVLRLRFRPSGKAVALLAVEDLSNVVKLLARLEEETCGALCAFEVMWSDFYHYSLRALGARPPLGCDAPHFVIVETLGRNDADAAQRLEEALCRCGADSIIIDAVIAASETQARKLWLIRENVDAFMLPERTINFDVSLGLADMGHYTESVKVRVRENAPKTDIFAFGHLGDNNLHLAVIVGDDEGALIPCIKDIVYEALVPIGGSISAEHGIGLDKRPYLELSRSRAELDMMRDIKRAIDPRAILGRNRIFES